MAVKLGRNDPCFCGSGKKFKHCHGGLAATVATPQLLSSHEIGALVQLVDQGRLSEAETAVRSALLSHPNAGILWKILSVALVRQRKDALQALRRAAELLPNDAEALRNMGAALHDQGQWAAALDTLQQALAIEPNDVDTLVDTANALRGLGRAREAVPLYERALSLSPRLVEARNNLGNAFLELGQYADAVSCYRLALGLKPGDEQVVCNLVNALNNLGNVLRDSGERRSAVPLYAQAIELDPGRAESHCNLGNVLFELRQIDEAVARYRQALALQPDHAPAHLGLALAFRQQRRPADAQLSCQAALAINPSYVEALSFLGELRADGGQFGEAEKLFQRAIEINPDFSFALASIATHRKMTPDDTKWLQRAEALAAKQLPLGHEISLRYALGKYFDDVRQYDAAFSHYRQANELTQRYGIKYNRTGLTQRIDQIIRNFDTQLMCQFRDGASASEVPVLIVGMPRSGTSLTEQILASHPAVFGGGEVAYWNAAYDAYRDAQLEGKAGADLVPGMASNYLDQLASLSGGAPRVVDKMPANFMYAGLIHAAFPRARIIHMQRHPLDTCLSIYFQNFFNIGPYANELDDLAHYYGEYVRITNHWRAVLPATALLEVPYEALIADQESWTRRMLDFIGLPWDPKCLDFHQTDRAVITASRWQVRQKIHTASAGRWRNYEKYVAPLRHLVPGVRACPHG
jgi:tetratricopeptide (TPR) repeat protein